MRILLVTGSRDWRAVRPLLEAIVAFRLDLVLTGGARGADQLARELARNQDVHPATVDALWTTRGKRAGFERNQALVDLAATLRAGGATVEVLAVGGGTPGTEDCIWRAAAAGLPVRRLAWPDRGR